MIRVLLHIISPTLLIATCLKRLFDPTLIIRILNRAYFWFAVSSVLVIWGLEYSGRDLRLILPSCLIDGWMYFVWARALEIFYAFIKDATEKVRRNPISTSKVSFQERVILSLRSYAELVLGFGVYYWLSPSTWWKGCESAATCTAPRSIVDSLYFSGVTITTVGYGDIVPAAPILKLLVVFEVLSGFALLAVSFAVYVSHGLQEPSKKQHAD